MRAVAAQFAESLRDLVWITAYAATLCGVPARAAIMKTGRYFTASGAHYRDTKCRRCGKPCNPFSGGICLSCIYRNGGDFNDTDEVEPDDCVTHAARGGLEGARIARGFYIMRQAGDIE